VLIQYLELHQHLQHVQLNVSGSSRALLDFRAVAPPWSPR
jgi:hypothetical protein